MSSKSVLFFLQFLLLTAVGGTALASSPLPQNNRAPGGNDSIVAPTDTAKTRILDSLKANTDIKSTINYKAEDSIVFDITNSTLFMFKKGDLKYEDIGLKSDSIAVNWETNILYAKGLMDSTGKITGQPTLTESESEYSAKEIAYNFKTQRGKVKFVRTQMEDGYIIADVLKKDGNETYYIKDGKFTTCDLDHPHFYIKSKKLKVIPGDKIISGPLMLYIEDFPLPIVVPFGFFPNQSGKRSGVVFPTYGESADRGFFLRDGGYYFAVSDYMDFQVTGDIFSKGGYRLALSSNYNKRYKYFGSVGIEYGVQKFGEKGDPDYNATQNFFVRWNDHQQTITPHLKLTANVQAGTSGYLSNNSYNEREYLTNTLKSNITFNKTFANSPWNAVLNLDHSQNTQTKQIQLGLPNLVVSRSRFFPFKSNKGVSKNAWYEKIGLNYTANLQNSIATPDSFLAGFLLRPKLSQNLLTPILSDGDTIGFDTTQVYANQYIKNGIVQRIPITTNLNLAKYINLSPSINYNEYWYFNTVEKIYNSAEGKTEDVYLPGFATARDFNASVNASTRLYGIYEFSNERKTHIRHTVLPSLSYTYQPDFGDSIWGYYRTVQSDSLGNTLKYSRFERGIFGGPSNGERQTVNFTLNNQFEMKRLKQEDEIEKEKGQDTTSANGPEKKIDPWVRSKLIDNIGVSTNYNFAADSMNLAPFNFNARTSFANNLISFQSSAVLDPYKVDINGRRYNEYLLATSGRLGRLTSFNFAVTASLRSKKRVGEVKAANQVPEDEMAHVLYYRDLYVDFSVPWTLNLNYNLRYTNSGINRDTTQTLNLTGDFNLTPKWKLGYTTGYDFSNRDFSYTSLTIYRDLHCWEMSVNWIPFGARKSYNFSINVKSATLKDLKLTRRRDWQDRFR